VAGFEQAATLQPEWRAAPRRLTAGVSGVDDASMTRAILPSAAVVLLLALSALALGACRSRGNACVYGDRTVYQDGPCDIYERGPPRPDENENTAVEQLSLAGMYWQMKAAGEQQREVEAGFRADLERSRQALGGKRDPEFERLELERINELWRDRMRAAQARNEALQAELNRRCNGASLNPTEQFCGQSGRPLQ